MVHHNLFKKSLAADGDIIECGVFKGASFCALASFRDLLAPEKKLIGFDTFDKFPEEYSTDNQKYLKDFLKTAGSQSIDRKSLITAFRKKGIKNKVELVQGDIIKTIPNYIKKNPGLKISFLNLDVDMYEPTLVTLEYFWPKISKNGILVLDDYNVFPGETKAVNNYFKNKKINIKKYSYRETPYYIIKKG